MSSEGLRLLYVTTKDAGEARAIAMSLLVRGLIACANIIKQMESLYSWQGKIQSGSEAVLILKTRESRVQEVTELITEIHSYDCPCVLSLPIESAPEEYRRWILSEVGDHGSDESHHQKRK